MKTAPPSTYQRGRREARNREVAVEERFGILRLGGDLAEEESPPAPVLLGRNVALHDVDESRGSSASTCARVAGKVSNACDSGAMSKSSRVARRDADAALP